MRKERIQRYGDQFALTGALGDPVASYSHGMKQKLAIISALIHEPKLMILDEPFVGLDPKATLLLKNTMHEMCQRGAAIFFSTHVLDVAEKDVYKRQAGYLSVCLRSDRGESRSMCGCGRFP